MPELARITAIGEQQPYSQPEKPSTDGVARLADEPVLWYRRYTIYRELGHKRSLRAAVAKERETIHVVDAQEKTTNSPKEKGKPTTQTAKVVNVPGSWKNAAKVYRWQERAHAFDADLIDKMVEETYKMAGNSFANKYKRVQYLSSLLKNVQSKLDETMKKGTSHEVYQSYIKLLAALAKQIEHEMSTVTEEDMKLAIGAYGMGIQDKVEKAMNVGQTN